MLGPDLENPQPGRWGEMGRGPLRRSGVSPGEGPGGSVWLTTALQTQVYFFPLKHRKKKLKEGEIQYASTLWF